MSDIDWENIAEEADNLPASILAECLAMADEWEDCIIICLDKAGELRTWHSIRQIPIAVAMLAYTQHKMMHRAQPEIIDGHD